jgi:methionine-rich copper-binding protein CopC
MAITRVTIVSAIALTAGSGPVLAHAELHHATPAAGSTVSEAPHEVTLIFSESLEAAFSSADVTDSSGARVEEGKPQISGETIRVGLKALPPGSYRVHWRAVAADTHKSEGTFTFNVKGP